MDEKLAGRDPQPAVRIVGIGVSGGFTAVGNAVLVEIAAGVRDCEIGEFLALPGIGDSIGIGIGTCDGLGNEGGKIDPTHIGTVGIAGKLSGEEGEAWAAGIVDGAGRAVVAEAEIDPADVRAPSKSGEIAEAVVIDAVIRAVGIGIADSIDWRGVAETDPSAIGAVGEPGAGSFADDEPPIRCRSGVDPADVRPVEVGRGWGNGAVGERRGERVDLSWRQDSGGLGTAQWKDVRGAKLFAPEAEGVELGGSDFGVVVGK